jgi:catechol 2,3-dioxygenase-like lactoylglutathione lyase family enzyme
VICGINHVTLSVNDLDCSFAFYTQMLGLVPVVKWHRGSYLSAGGDWVCLSLDAHARREPLPEYTHLAFSVDREEFASRAASIRAQGAVEWKKDTSEGASLYVLDPDGHKIELHAGDLESRLRSLRNKPYDGLQWFDRSP